MKTNRLILACALALAACHEISQTAPKPFAAKDDTQLHEKALAARAQKQNEYVRMGDVPAN